MSLWFVSAIVLVAVAIIAALVRLGTRNSTGFDAQSAHNSSGWITGIALAVALICTFVASSVIVSTKNVGIETQFGRPVSSFPNGYHFIVPWDETTEMDAAIQTDSHYHNNSNGCINVRIAHQAVGCVDTSIRWRINEGAADSLFQNYRDFSNVRDSLVTRDLNGVMNNVFETYDVLAVDEQGNHTGPTLAAMSQQVAKQVQATVGNQIDVQSVIIPVINFDDNTQGRINALQSQIAQTRIAQQAVTTAKQQAIANGTLSASVSNDPNVLVSKCMDLLNEMISKGQTIPIGFSCWPGGSSSVVVPAK